MRQLGNCSTQHISDEITLKPVLGAKAEAEAATAAARTMALVDMGNEKILQVGNNITRNFLVVPGHRTIR